jgi:hypothetical protein
VSEKVSGGSVGIQGDSGGWWRRRKQDGRRRVKGQGRMITKAIARKDKEGEEEGDGRRWGGYLYKWAWGMASWAGPHCTRNKGGTRTMSSRDQTTGESKSYPRDH